MTPFGNIRSPFDQRPSHTGNDTPRMNLIPQDMRITHTEGAHRARSPSPRRYRRSPSLPTRQCLSRDVDRGYQSRRDQHSRY